ncbi:hypothetical protein ACLOJK_005417 [Asimina triloba]
MDRAHLGPGIKYRFPPSLFPPAPSSSAPPYPSSSAIDSHCLSPSSFVIEAPLRLKLAIASSTIEARCLLPFPPPSPPYQPPSPLMLTVVRPSSAPLLTVISSSPLPLPTTVSPGPPSLLTTVSTPANHRLPQSSFPTEHRFHPCQPPSPPVLLPYRPPFPPLLTSLANHHSSSSPSLLTIVSSLANHCLLQPSSPAALAITVSLSPPPLPTIDSSNPPLPTTCSSCPLSRQQGR